MSKLKKEHFCYGAILTAIMEYNQTHHLFYYNLIIIQEKYITYRQTHHKNV